MKRQRRLLLILTQSEGFSPVFEPFCRLQTHLFLSLVQKPTSGHPSVGQRKQSDELRSIFLQAAITNFGVTELTLDHTKRMFDLGPHTGLELLGAFGELAPWRVLLRIALARAHCNVPIHTSGFRSLAGALLARISKDNFFFTVYRRGAIHDNSTTDAF